MPKRKPLRQAPQQLVIIDNNIDIDEDLEAKIDLVAGNAFLTEKIQRPTKIDTLDIIIKWVKAEGERISKDTQSFKKHVEYLMQENIDFYNWVISNNQKRISMECGISQAYTSVIFGPIQRENKEKSKEAILARVESGESTQSVAEFFGCSKRSVERLVSATKYNTDNLSQERDLVKKRLAIIKDNSIEDLADIIINKNLEIKKLKDKVSILKKAVK